MPGGGKSDKITVMRILHLQIEDFYITIEQRKQNAPPDAGMVIHFPEDPGFVVARSSSAGDAGIRLRMPLEKAKAVLPNGIFVPADFQLYANTSDQLNTRLRDLYPFTEQLDFYEWFCDLSDEESEDVQNALQAKLCDRYPFRLRVCLSGNKFLAKLGNETGRTIEAAGARDLLNDMPVEEFWGIPKKWIVQLKEMGIVKIGEIGGLDPDLLEKKFPEAGHRLVRLGRGEDDHEVQPFAKPSKLSRAATLRLSDDEEKLKKFLSGLAAELSEQLVKGGHIGFALRLEITGGGQRVSHRYRFLLPTVRTSSILVGAMSMLKKMRGLLPSEGSIEVNLAVDDIVYDRDVYQLHGSPRADLELMND